MKRYGIYLRVSTEEQAIEGLSVGTQEENCRNYVAKNNGIVVKVYKDLGISASKNLIVQRPGCVEMFEDAENNLIDAIVCIRRDRISRNTKDLYFLIDFYEKYHPHKTIEFVFESPFNPEDEGELMEFFQSYISKNEARKISKRVKEVMISKANKGEYTGGFVPYGYIRKDGKTIQVPEEIAIVHEIEKLYLSGYGDYTICKWLNGFNVKELGVRNGGAVPRRIVNRPNANQTMQWTVDSVKGILKNPFYCGYITYGKTNQNSKNQKKKKFNDKSEWIIVKGEHEPCRKEEIHEQLQEIRRKRVEKLTPPRQYITSYLLTGIAYCGECGEKLKGYTTAKLKSGEKIPYHYYVCESRRHNKIWKNCKLGYIPQELLEKLIVEQVKRFATTVDINKIIQEVNKIVSESKTEYYIELNNIENELVKLEKKRKKNLMLLEDEEDDELINEYRQRQKEIVNEIKIKQQSKQKLEKIISNDSNKYLEVQEFCKIINNFDELWNNATKPMKIKYLESIIKKITINKDLIVDIHFNFNFNF